MELDLTDDDVRAMAERDHSPNEEWRQRGTMETKILVRVYCDECGQSWPCSTKERLRNYEKTRPF